MILPRRNCAKARVHISSPRPDNQNAKRIIAAAESGKYKNMACIARKVGVSRERVRQILNATGHANFGQRHVRLQWRCPDCGTSIKTTASQLRGHMTAHCRKCAQNYCFRGHLRSKHALADGRCGVCDRNQKRSIVEIRTCIECGNDLEISSGMRYQIKRGNARGDFHIKCYFAYLRREGRPTRRHKPPRGAA